MARYWFDPDAMDEDQRKASQSDPDQVRGTGDFGSYAMTNRGGGLIGSDIEGHNLIHARQRVAMYASILRGRPFKRIADIGCGLGITTAALAEHYPKAHVVGVEVSSDAVAFGRRNWPQVEFIQMAVAPSTPLPYGFDLILCQEFHPFTRTGDLEPHRSFVEYFLTHLIPGGQLLIELSERDRERTVLANIDALGVPTETKTLPFDRVYRSLPFFRPALVSSLVLAQVLSRPLNKCILIRR